MTSAAKVTVFVAIATAFAGSGIADPISKRTEYRYPDRPDVVYSDAGVRSVSHDDPLAFTNEKSAISEQDAQNFLAKRYGRSAPAPQKVQASPVATMVATPLPPLSPQMAPPQHSTLAVQVGAYSSTQNAERVAAKLRHYGVVDVKQAQIKGKSLFRVFVAAGNSKSEANAMLARLKADGFDGFVTKV